MNLGFDFAYTRTRKIVLLRMAIETCSFATTFRLPFDLEEGFEVAQGIVLLNTYRIPTSSERDSARSGACIKLLATACCKSRP